MVDNSSSTLQTDAIKSYDGIFKGMHDDELRKKFMEARKSISAGAWKQGKQLIIDALSESERCPLDKVSLELILDELNRYETCKITPGTKPVKKVAWDNIAERHLLRLSEKFFNLPQSIFFLDLGRTGKSGSVRLIGRKLLSEFWIAGKIPELHCSLISSDMILGLFSDQRITENYVHVFYHPLSDAEKLGVMQSIMDSDISDVELIFPFPLLREATRKELCSAPEGWVVDDAYDVMLGCGEERIREYTINFLGSNGLNSAKLYDPACSTGVFLSTLKKSFPNSYTIGQDLSQQMTDVSRTRVDEVHCGNAMTPKIKSGTADAVFIRFLNSEVVTSSEAEDLLQALFPTVKSGGYMVTFGHTPVLLSSSNYRQLSNFTFKQSIGVASGKAGIFQYYVIQRQ